MGLVLNHIEVCTKDEQELMLESTYFGEVFIKNNPNIYWGYLSKPKKLHGVNRPRLLGFAGDMSVYPYGRVEMCIWKTIISRKFWLIPTEL